MGTATYIGSAFDAELCDSTETIDDLRCIRQRKHPKIHIITLYDGTITSAPFLTPQWKGFNSNHGKRDQDVQMFRRKGSTVLWMGMETILCFDTYLLKGS